MRLPTVKVVFPVGRVGLVLGYDIVMVKLAFPTHVKPAARLHVDAAVEFNAAVFDEVTAEVGLKITKLPSTGVAGL